MFNNMTFKKLDKMNYIMLYAGDIPNMIEYDKDYIVGLSIKKSNKKHIKHDITLKMPIKDNSIDAYQAEDVLEHIEYDRLVSVFNEIYRVLKPNGYFRLSIPDYRCDILYNRSLKDDNGEIIFDPFGGGKLEGDRVLNGGHLWFPTYEKVLNLINNSNFIKFNFYHFYNSNGESITNKIDYSKGFIQRTPDNDERVKNPYRAMSIVVDLFK